MPTIRPFLSVIEELYVFASGSYVLNKFQQFQREEDESISVATLKRIFELRWTAQYSVLKTFRQRFIPLIKTLRCLVNEDEAQRKIKAVGFLHYIDAEFIFTLVALEYIMSRQNIMAKALQSKEMEILSVLKLVDETKNLFENMIENQSHWAVINNAASRLCNEANITWLDRQPRRQDINSTQSPQGVKSHIFEMAIRSFLTEINVRFNPSTCTILRAFGSFSNHPIVAGDLMPLVVHYKSFFLEKDIDDLSAEVDLYNMRPQNQTHTLLEILPTISHLKMIQQILKIGLTLSITTASTERSFSALKLIKTWLRTRMEQDRLSDLGMIGINSQLARNLDIEELVERYVLLNPDARLRLV